MPECQGTSVQNRHNIRNLSDCNGTGTHNLLVYKRNVLKMHELKFNCD